MIKMILGFLLITGGLIACEFIPHYIFEFDVRYFVGLSIGLIMWLFSEWHH